MRIIVRATLLAFCLLLPASLQAQIIGSLPVTLTNGTLADANQVMSDFNKIVTDVNANAAKNGSNSDITALNGLTTPITPAQGGSSVYTGGGSGSANAQLVVTPTPLNFSLTSGNTVNFIPSVSNTGPATLSVAGTTAKNILRQTSGGLQSLSGGEIVANQIATVIYDGTQYELINTAVSSNVLPCTEIDYQGVAPPSGYLFENGQAVSRTTYASLFGCLAYTSVAATTVSGNPSVTVADSSLYSVGWYVGGTNTSCNSTIISKADSTHITLSSNASGNGATTLTIGPQPQGDCSTTFNIPNMQGRGSVNIDAAGSTLSGTACPNPSTTGARCGSTTQTILTANLPPYTPAGSVSVSSSPTNNVITGTVITIQPPGGGSNVQVLQNGTANQVTLVSTGSLTGTAQGGTSTPFLLQPVGLVLKLIKF